MLITLCLKSLGKYGSGIFCINDFTLPLSQVKKKEKKNNSDQNTLNIKKKKENFIIEIIGFKLELKWVTF